MTAEKVDVYAIGLICLSVCAPKTLSKEEVEEAVNLIHPTGISGHWRISEDEAFATGELIPKQCEFHEDRQHWLLNC